MTISPDLTEITVQFPLWLRFHFGKENYFPFSKTLRMIIVIHIQ